MPPGKWGGASGSSVGSAGRAARQVEIVLMPGVNALKPVVLHQLKNLASLRLFKVVLDGERGELVSIERKAAERFKLSPFDVKARDGASVRGFAHDCQGPICAEVARHKSSPTATGS